MTNNAPFQHAGAAPPPPPRPPRRRRPSLGGPIMLLVTALLISAGIGSGHLPPLAQWPERASDMVSQAASGEVGATSTPAPPQSTAGLITPASGSGPAPKEGLREGQDYALWRSPSGQLVRWSCDAPIRIVVAKGAPQGTATALRSIAEELASVSGHRFTVSARSESERGAITVHYAKPGVSIDGIRVTGNEMGRGGPRFAADGSILRGVVVMRDTPDNRPGQRRGYAVLKHEVIHAMGLDHADQSAAAVMTPRLQVGVMGNLGPGDRYGLTRVGCW